MSRRDDGVSMRHMLLHAREAEELVRGKSRRDLRDDRVLQLALTRLMEIVGEAASRVSDESRGAWPEVPWLQIVGMRNRLIHGYDFVDWDLLWDTVSDDLPPLIVALDRILGEPR